MAGKQSRKQIHPDGVQLFSEMMSRVEKGHRLAKEALENSFKTAQGRQIKRIFDQMLAYADAKPLFYEGNLAMYTSDHVANEGINQNPAVQCHNIDRLHSALKKAGVLMHHHSETDYNRAPDWIKYTPLVAPNGKHYTHDEWQRGELLSWTRHDSITIYPHQDGLLKKLRAAQHALRLDEKAR